MLDNNGNLSIRPGRVEDFILEMFDKLEEEGILPLLVEDYAAAGEIEPERFTPQIKRSMVGYLVDRGLQPDVDKFNNGDYEEHFALAYNHAVDAVSGRADPIDGARRGARTTGWDFSVRTFDYLEELGVVAENILAAGAIDYIYELGENLKCFALRDVVLRDWWNLEFEEPSLQLDDLLHTAMLKKRDRLSVEERMVLYKRVLNKGLGEIVNGRGVINERFPMLWGNFVSEIAEYIDKGERIQDGLSDTSPVSPRGIYQSMRDLQYNLTEHATGAAHRQAWELYAQLEECFEILEHEEVLRHYGVSRRKGMFGLIEKVGRREFDMALAVGPRLRMAVDGNKLFQSVSAFSGTPMRHDDFVTLVIEPGESYILNAAAAGEEPDAAVSDQDEDFDAFEDEEDDFGDDF